MHTSVPPTSQHQIQPQLVTPQPGQSHRITFRLPPLTSLQTPPSKTPFQIPTSKPPSLPKCRRHEKEELKESTKHIKVPQTPLPRSESDTKILLELKVCVLPLSKEVVGDEVLSEYPSLYKYATKWQSTVESFKSRKVVATPKPTFVFIGKSSKFEHQGTLECEN